MGANKEKKSAWLALRMRRVLGSFGVVLVAYGYYSEFTGYRRDTLIQWGAFILGIVSIATAYRWKCPRCGKNYLVAGEGGGMRVPWSEVCGHCGLPEGQDPLKWQETVPKPEATYPREYPVPDPKIARRKTQETFLRVVLRDDPRAVGLKPDEHGWFRVEDLLHRAKRHRINLRRDELDEILSEDMGCRFESGGGGELIRYKRES